MNRIRRLCRTLASLPRRAGALLASAAAAPAVLAVAPPLPPGWNKHPSLPLGHIHQPVHQAPVPVPVHTVVIGGMPGWQITLIAAGRRAARRRASSDRRPGTRRTAAPYGRRRLKP
jgi:hypothetical protein